MFRFQNPLVVKIELELNRCISSSVNEYFTKPLSLGNFVYTTFGTCVNMMELMIIKFKSLRIFGFVCSDFMVGGWVSRNPIVVRILKSVGKNGRSLSPMPKSQ